MSQGIMKWTPLIHHQGTTCCVDCGRSSLRSMTYTPHSSLLVALLMARDGAQPIASRQTKI